MEKQANIKVNGIDFSWDLESGKFMFEQQDAMLFWISSAMRSFFDTIEEITGEEASQLVFETTGFRQGLMVGEYFQNMKNVSVEEAAKLITNTYASAGWGLTVIEDLDVKANTFKAKFINSWEHKINEVQGKSIGGKYIPAHYAGIFTGMFGTNIWYEVNHYQLEGYEHTEVKYFPSDITVNNNISELAKKTEMNQIMQLEALVEDKTRDLNELIKKLSSPVIPVLEGIVVVPLIGKYDEERSMELVEKTLNNIPSYKANYLILDLTGLDENISKYTAQLIENIASATALIGVKTILVGISPELSKVIAQSDVQLLKFDCFRTLQHGIHYSLGQMGRRII
ncbi:STAS domain-containing protein [Psychrobacillus sp. FJAT-51614]|uniref:STAS domain-containing protein n=1 Tax=Psychrobacillus mangrovi TaxID=3117745 RepID=A0ABU8F8P2_9BACI